MKGSPPAFWIWDVTSGKLRNLQKTLVTQSHSGSTQTLNSSVALEAKRHRPPTRNQDLMANVPTFAPLWLLSSEQRTGRSNGI